MLKRMKPNIVFKAMGLSNIIEYPEKLIKDKHQPQFRRSVGKEAA